MNLIATEIIVSVSGDDDYISVSLKGADTSGFGKPVTEALLPTRTVQLVQDAKYDSKIREAADAFGEIIDIIHPSFTDEQQIFDVWSVLHFLTY